MQLKSKYFQDYEELISSNNQDLRTLIIDILEVLYLQIQTTRKQNTEMITKMDTLRVEEQCRIVRAMFDYSPIQYTTCMLPWIVGSLVVEDQVSFTSFFFYYL